MGKRSRKRGASGGADISPSGSSRAERDEARRRRAQAAQRRQEAAGTSGGARPRRRGRPTIDERPPAPWGNFPLVELSVLIAIVLFVAGIVVGGERGQIMLTGALALGSLAGLELSIREHFAGYRSHSTLIAAVFAFVSMAVTFFAAGKGDAARVLLLPVAGVVFMGSFYWLREVFKRRSGGLGFR